MQTLKIKKSDKNNAHPSNQPTSAWKINSFFNYLYN